MYSYDIFERVMICYRRPHQRYNGWMHIREADIVFNWTGMPGSKVKYAFSNPDDWIVPYVRTYLDEFVGLYPWRSSCLRLSLYLVN